MNRAKILQALPVSLFILTAGGWFLAGRPAQAQNVQHLTITQPGGMPGLPVVTGIEKNTNGFSVLWDGPPGYYQLYQKSTLQDAQWQAVGGYNVNRKADITTLNSNAFFRVLGPSPSYAGAESCQECHGKIHSGEMNTRHAGAFTNRFFVLAGGQTNASCLPCHTVGYGLPSGFVNLTATPHLAGVQCENCHGPAGNHLANENDFASRPRAEVAATLCGGCHTGSHHPTFDEWKTTGHAAVVEDMNPASRISSCGRCHSGTARLAMLKGQDPVVTVTGDANVGIVCITCHDPHQTNGNPAQLRNPVASLVDYSLSTSDVFTNKYNPNINVCAQCHNHRGAAYTSSSRPPHHSPQYNILLGTVGETTTGQVPFAPGSHALLIANQCVGCHMQTASQKDGPPEVAAVTGHKFKVETYNACLPCHAPDPEGLARFNMFGIVKVGNNDIIIPGFGVSNRVQQVKGLLNNWATNKAPATLRTKYGALAWEYTTAGALSTPPGGTASGPSTADQALVPDNIKKARFNLYLVLHDGSYGVHNPGHVSSLLDSALNWVQTELSK